MFPSRFKLKITFCLLLVLISWTTVSVSFSGVSIENLDSDIQISTYYFSSPTLDDVDTINLTIFFNADMHGWIEPHDGYGGSASMMGYFQNEGYTYDNDSFLILGGGDHNTGPAEATLSKGEALIDVMNAMNYSAAAIGNHEFDFGIDIMEYQKENATFPLLSCNIYDEGTTDNANFTVPYVIQEHAGIKVGIIGLTIGSLYARYDIDYDIGNYETAVRNCISDVESDGAEIIILLTHVSPNQLDALAASISDLGIEIFLGGHSHVSYNTWNGNTLIVATKPHSMEYAKISIVFDNSTKTIASKSAELVYNMEGGSTPDSSVQQVVDYWVNEINASEVITYASSDVYDGYPESAIGNLVTDGFLYHFGWSHNFGITNNGGGFRDYFRQGSITLGDIVSVIPFENNLLELTMTGDELLQVIENNHDWYSFSGIRYRFYYDPGLIIHSVQIFENDGFYDLNPSKTYKGLMTDFSWWQYHYGLYSAVDTGVHYRDAVVEYFRTLTDISSHTYDDRILETDQVFPGVGEFNWIYPILIMPVSILVMVIARVVKRKNVIAKNKIL